MNSFIFVFLDGFGLGEATSNNPLFKNGIKVLEKFIGEKLISGIDVQGPELLFRGIDASLGVQGLPQSATGQTSLFTGKNASQILGYHLPAFPNQILIEVISEHNILKKLTDYGCSATFANAYSDCYFKRALSRKNTHSVTTHCMLTAKLQHRTIDDLLNNNAVYWDISRESIINDLKIDLELVDPFIAGTHLSKIARAHDLVLFESFATDIIGHKCDIDQANAILEKLDSFFSGIIDSMDKGDNLLICSDHGNIEDLSTGAHTSNPVPLIIIGPDAYHFKHVERIDQVTPTILRILHQTE